ncbi:MAG: IS1634 family transposase [Candidatus Dormibacteria bacterium]
MYLRTTKRRNSDGSEVSYYQLAENVWDQGRRCAVAKVIYNFGRADQVDGEQLRRLAKSILRVFGGDGPTAGGEAAGDVRLRDTWPYGGVYVLEALWKELGIGEVLRGHASPQQAEVVERAVFVMVANRCLSPCSKLYCWEQWLREEVFLPSAETLALHHLYRAMDFFEEHKTEVEKALYFKMADLMNADVDLIFYDTTSLHFEVDEEDEVERQNLGLTYEPLRKRGHSKNGRTDAPQIVVGMAVTRDGLPVRSWVFPGNTADVTTIEKVKQDLRGWRLGRCVFVGDAGMNSEENRRTLALGNGKYILASRMRAGDEVTHDVLTRPGRYKAVRENLRVKEVIVGDGERRRRYVVCHNPAEEVRQRQHRAKLLVELGLELASMRTRADGKTSKRTSELLTSARYGKYLRQTGDGKLHIHRTAVKEAERYDGKWVITSNDDTLTAEDLALGYKQLLRVEACWRQMKSGLRMRPVFHFRPWRIQAHVSISVLALLLERVAEIRTGDTWRNLAAQLQKIQVVEYDRGEARVRQTTEVRPELELLLRKLNVALPPKLHSVVPVPESQVAPTPTSPAGQIQPGEPTDPPSPPSAP